MNNIKKKLIILGLIVVSAIALTGCGSGLQEFAESTLPQAIRDRGEVNKKMAADFKTIGAISETQYQSILENIDKQVAKYAKVESDGHVSSDTLSVVANAVSEYTLGGGGAPSYVVYIDEDGKSSNLYHEGGDYTNKTISISDGTCATKGDGLVLPNFIISNYLNTYHFGNKVADIGAKHTVEEKDVVPVELISKDIADQLNDLTKAEVYVLRPDITTATGEQTMDGIIAKMKDAIAETDKNNQQRLLANYFYKALDADGNAITLIDRSEAGAEYNLIGNSRPNDGGKNEPGYDLIIGQYDMEDCIHVRFTEFRKSAYDVLNAFISQSTGGVYLVNDSTGTWKAYVMQYPIDVISELKDTGDGNVEVSFDKSGLGVNLMTGKFIKYTHNDGTDSWEQTDCEAVESSDYYLTLQASQNNDAEGICSLVVKGVTTTSITDTSGSTYEMECGRIVLRDYLEAAYAPKYKDEETMVVFGRKIRFDMSDSFWTKDTVKTKYGSYQEILNYPKKSSAIAYFVDKDGNRLATAPELAITDFADFEALNKEDYEESAVVTIVPDGRIAEETEATFKDGVVPTTAQLKHIYIDDTGMSTSEGTFTSIKPTAVFPGWNIGVADYEADSSTKQRFYAIATSKGLFDSALYGSWVASTASTASLDWWNGYLSGNDFIYTVGKNELAEYLKGNYAYELSQNGIVVLDLETVATIQEMYDKDSDTGRVRFIRTAFVVIGWALIAFSMVLLLLWTIDTNTDIGISLLEKATFGNWVAVKYEDDVPAQNASEQKYLTFGPMFIKVMILIAVGILLIRINVFDIIQVLIHVFGNIASELDKLIKGMK